MQELWSSASYEPHLLSLAFAVAPAALLSVIAYTAAMRGAPVLRAWLLAHMLALLPYAVAMTLSPSIVAEDVAEGLFRVAAGGIPVAAASGTAFQLALVRRYRRYRWLVWGLLGNALVWLWLVLATDQIVTGVAWLGAYWFPLAGPYAWIAVINTIAIMAVGVSALAWAALRAGPAEERRQQRAAVVAMVITYGGTIDVALSYGVEMYPIGWFLSGVGCLLVVRAMVVEDLLRVRAVDAALPRMIAHYAAAVVFGWFALEQLGARAPWWATVAVLGLVLGGSRTALAALGLLARRGRGEGPLERLLAQLARRARDLTSPRAIADLATDIVELGLGARPVVLLAAEEDWGWTDASGARLADDAAPDPLLAGWLAEHGAPVFADDLDPVPADLRDLMARLLERHAARAVLVVRSADELLALLALPAAGGRVRGRGLAFAARVADRLAEALLHARMARRAAARAALAREVELAATVQAELLPGAAPHAHGAVTVVGSWRPATRCAGDFWGVYPLGPAGERVLIAVGDVTGHGVASAMVTAAAAGACEVCARRGGADLALGDLVLALDAAVRRVGGGQLEMTCAAAILDAAAGELAYVSCGHPAPYVCRPAASGAGVELAALVARGTPLGAAVPPAARVQRRAIAPGDLVVWYTDGVIEAQDPTGRPFGDRRLQHLLRRLDRQRLSPEAVHDLVQAGVAAHRAGRPLADDETVVVAQLAPPALLAQPAPPAPPGGRP